MAANVASSSQSSSEGFAHLLRALRHRNYRLFFMGQGLSLVGTWMTSIATSWLVYRLTHSAWLLGIVGFAGQVPTFVLAPVGGVLGDRWNRHRILVATQVLAMLQSLALAWLALAGVITVGHIIGLSVFQGMINAFDLPARQAFVVEMVEPGDLGNAIALNSSIFNGARLIGPAIAGVLIGIVGEGWCFLVDGISYLAVIAALLAMQLSPRPSRSNGAPIGQQFMEGLRYAFGFPPIRAVLLLVALMSLAGMPSIVLMPVVAGQILHGGAHIFGFLMSASGVGALLGALYLASRKSVLGLGRIIALAGTLFGIGLILFSFSQLIGLSLLLMPVIGFGMLVHMASSNTLLQTIVDDDKRGRIMSLYAMAFMGMAPLGSLLAGSLASHMGVAKTLLLSGGCCVVAAQLFARAVPKLRPFIRPIYVKKGILPEVAVGVHAAVELSTPPED